MGATPYEYSKWIPTPTRATTQRRCPGCRSWYENPHRDCPECGHPGQRANFHLDKARKDAHLFSQAAATSS